LGNCEREIRTLEIAIIGGGLSALSAAMEISTNATNPVKIHIYEKKSQLGGRIMGINSAKIGKVDFGQHLISGAYHNTFSYLKKVQPNFSIKDLVEQKLHFIRDNKVFPFKNPHFIFPINLILGLISNKYFTFSEKLKLLEQINYLKKNKYSQKSISELLILDETKFKNLNNFWKKLLLSVFNTGIENIEENQLHYVIKNIFSSSSGNSRFYLPKSTLAKLFVHPFLEKSKQFGIEIFLKNKINRISFLENDKVEIAVNNGNTITYDYVISTIQPNEIEQLLHPKINFPNKWKGNSIITINFKLKKILLKNGMFAISDSFIDWLFIDKLRATIVISNSEGLQHLNNNDLIGIIFQEINKKCNSFSMENVVNFDVLKIKKATMLSENLIINLQEIIPFPYNRLLFAGDWTILQIPQTIESAILSGKIVSERIIKIQQNLKR